MKNRLLVSAGTLGAVAIAGFLVGHIGHSAAAQASAAPAQMAPAAAATNAAPALPADFSVPAGALANMQLQFSKSELRPFVRTIAATGTVGYNQLRLARITPPARGQIEAIDVVVGDHVRAGQQLAMLDNFDLSGARSGVASAQAAVAQAKAQLVTAQAALARAAELVRTGGMAESVLDQRRADAASMQAQLSTREAELKQWQDTVRRLMPAASTGPGTGNANPVLVDPGPQDSQGAIVAPFDGIVDQVAVSPGQIVDPTQQTFTVADLSTVWVEVQLPESDLAAVQVGDQVAIHVDAYPGRQFTGRVTYIADRIDPNTGTVAVRCAVPNPDGALRVNMFATADIASPAGREAVLVPSSALQDINGQKAVFVPTGNGHFTWHAIQPGQSSGGFTEVVHGLAAGTPVVAAGSYWLKAELMQSTIPDEG